MRKRFLLCMAIVSLVALVSSSLYKHFSLAATARPVVIAPATQPRLKVLLLPLDSRPPCTQFVAQLAEVANINLISPPPELLDYYKTPARKAELRQWLRQTAAAADAAIISADMLVHGGLLASRQSLGTAADANATLQLLEELHQANPGLKLYAFNIIPRLLIADSETNARFQENMRKYSVLKDQVLAFENPPDVTALTAMEKEIPAAVIARYTSLIEANAAFNLKLIDMAERGVLSGLVIGQDDGYPFGLPNMVKHRLTNYVSQRPHLTEHVFITRGTDEVAISLLGHLVQQNTVHRPKAFVAYSYPAAAAIVMPFMPHSVARTVQEKLDIAGATPVSKLEEADFVLYVHVGTQKTGPGSLSAAARDVKRLMAAGNKVALVDLTEDFYGHETLLPYLLLEDVPIPGLIAYAGWNTTSNSLGTAVTQAVLFTQTLKGNKNHDNVLRVYQSNLEFLTARLLDDWYYQKDVEPSLKKYLQAMKIDKYNLGDNYASVSAMIAARLQDRCKTLFRQGYANHHLVIDTDQGRQLIFVSDLNIEAALPWPRTFEVKITPKLSLSAYEN